MKLKEAAEICQGTLALNQRGKSPRDWAAAQNNLGNVLQELGKRSGAEEGRKRLEGAVAAYRSALEVRTKADLPQDWAMTQNNLGLALQEQGVRTSGAKGTELLAQAVAAYRNALEVFTHGVFPAYYEKVQENLAKAENLLNKESVKFRGQSQSCGLESEEKPGASLR